MTEKGNQHATKHGGEAAVKSLAANRQMTGPAAAAELDARAAYEVDGATAMILTQACRLEAACDLYWQALLAAATARDLDKVDSYAARFGWLANSSIRAWVEVAKHDRSKGKGGKLAEVLEAYGKEATGTAERSATAEAGINHGETITQEVDL